MQDSPAFFYLTTRYRSCLSPTCLPHRLSTPSRRTPKPSVRDHDTCLCLSWFLSARTCGCLACFRYNDVSWFPDHLPVSDYPSACSSPVRLPRHLDPLSQKHLLPLTSTSTAASYKGVSSPILPHSPAPRSDSPVQDPWIPQSLCPHTHRPLNYISCCVTQYPKRTLLNYISKHLLCCAAIGYYTHTHTLHLY